MAKHRSLRLLKKLHLGPFRQFGFALVITSRPGLSEAELDVFLDDFLSDCIDANGLVFGGGLDAGWIDSDGHGSATEAHQALVKAWLAARPECAMAEIGPLRDAWYGPFE